MTTRKNICLTRWTFVDKVMCLLFNMLPRLVITFLPRNKRLFISWLQSPSAVILEPRKIKSAIVSTVFPSICHEVMGPDVVAAKAQHRPRGATPCPRSGAMAKRSYPTSKVRSKRLHFAGAAVKRYPTSKVREAQVRLSPKPLQKPFWKPQECQMRETYLKQFPVHARASSTSAGTRDLLSKLNARGTFSQERIDMKVLPG